MTHKKTNEEFIQEVRKLVGDEYNFLEPYRGKAVKIKVRHEPCGHTYPVTPNSFLSGGNRCQQVAQYAEQNRAPKSEPRKTKALLLKLNKELVMNTSFSNHILTKTLKYEFGITLAEPFT